MTEKDYITVDQLQTNTTNFLFSKQEDYERAITSASRWVDLHCNRHFWREPSPVTRPIRATGPAVISPGDFPDADEVEVEVDLAGDGVFTPFDAALWQPEPFVLVNGWPYQRITPTTDVSWPWDARRARVRVTARWGWAEVPSAVIDATRLIAVEILMGTAIGAGDDSAPSSLAGPFEVAERLLEDYAPERPRDWRGRRR